MRRSPDLDPSGRVGQLTRIIDTFVSLVDTMVDDYDVIDFLGLLAEARAVVEDHVELEQP